MMPGYDTQQIKARLMVWWIVWASTLGGLIVLYLLFARGKSLPVASADNAFRGLVGIVPMFLSVVIRWLVLPRSTEPARAFVVFIVGVALAEACGILGLFLGGPYRDSLFLLGVFGLVQYVPLYARKFFDPKGSGYIPNN